MARANRIPAFDFHVEYPDAEERLETWIDFMRPIADFAPLNWSGSEGMERVCAWPTEKAIFIDTILEPHITKRDSYHVKNFAKPTLVTRMHVYGHSSTEVRSNAYITMPGDLNVVDFTETYSSVATRVRFFTFIVSHDMVNFDPAIHAAHIRMQHDTPRGTALASAFMRVMEGLPTLPVREAEAAIDHFLSLFAEMLDESVNDNATPLDPALRRQAEIRVFIENHLQSNGLTPKMLAEEFGISRATIYRDIEDLGGLQRYITRRRLEEACKELAFSAGGRGIVGDIARSWQFSSTAHFSREFRRHFGFNPSKAVNCALGPPRPPSVSKRRRESVDETPPWLERL